jgi:hypothetical protein
VAVAAGAVPVVVISGAGVSVGSDGVGVKAAAVNVNCATTVLAADVRIAATSDVGSAFGVPAAPHAELSTTTRVTSRVSLSFIKSLDAPLRTLLIL